MCESGALDGGKERGSLSAIHESHSARKERAVVWVRDGVANISRNEWSGAGGIFIKKVSSEWAERPSKIMPRVVLMLNPKAQTFTTFE